MSHAPPRYGRLTADGLAAELTFAEYLAAHLPLSKPSRRGVKRRVARLERAIARREYEAGFLVDPKTGQVLYEQGGTRSTISFPAKTTPLFKDAVFSHCHPRCSSLSEMDLDLAVDGNVAELRAVGVCDDGVQRTYVLRRPKSGWPKKGAMRRAVAKAERSTKRTINGAVRRRLMTREQARALYQHELVRRVAGELGLEYRVEE